MARGLDSVTAYSATLSLGELLPFMAKLGGCEVAVAGTSAVSVLRPQRSTSL